MKFSQHLGKGAWAFASRTLPILYAVAWLFVARKLPLAEFGTLTVFQSLFAMLFTFSDGFALQAIVKFGVEPDTNLEELVTVTVALFVGFLGVALTLLLVFRTIVGTILNNHEIGELLPWLAIFAFLTMPRVVFSKVLQGNFRMKEIFFVDFSNFGVASLVLGSLLLLGRVHSALDVIQITVATGFLSSLVATMLVHKYLRFRIRFSRAMFSRISSFVRYQAAIGLVSTAQQNFDTLIVSGFTGAVGAAVYGSAKLLFRAYDILRDTMGLFVFPAASKYYSRDDLSTLRTILEKSVSFLYLIAIPLGIILGLGAPILFHILFGGKYDSSVPVFRMLLIVTLVFPLQYVFGAALSGMGKIKQLFRMFLISFAVDAVIASTLLALTHSLLGAAAAYVITAMVLSVQYYRYLRRTIAFDPHRLFARGIRDAISFARALRESRNI